MIVPCRARALCMSIASCTGGIAVSMLGMIGDGFGGSGEVGKGGLW